MSAGDGSAMLMGIAQTNLQLLRQMQEGGYSEHDRARVREAYGIAASLFPNQFRACGKPFVAHLAGTAGVLAWLGASTEVVVAGLVHAAYQEGDFPRALPGMTPEKRAWLRAHVGDTIETLVAAYTHASRSLAGIQSSHARFDGMNEFERTVLLMQLANELDDYRDLAPLYAANADERLDKIRQCGDLQADMAEKLGYPELAQALRDTYSESLAMTADPRLRSAYANGYSILPASCKEAYGHLALRAVRKVRRILSRRFASR